MTRKKNPLPVLFSMVLLDQMAAWMLLPILPLLLVVPDSPFYMVGSATDAGFSGYVLLGLIFGVFPLMQFLASPLLGELSDKYGRKPAMVFSAVCITVGYVLFVVGVVCTFIPLLFIGRVLSGIGGGSLGVIFASAADISTEDSRAKHLAIIAAASGLGLILGPLLGGVLSDSAVLPFFSILTPLYLLTILAFVNVLIVSFYFSETLRTPQPSLVVKWNKPLSYIKNAYQSDNMKDVFRVSFLFSLSLALFVSFGPVLMYERFNLSESTLSYFLAYFGFLIIITQIVLLPYVSRECGQRGALRLGLVTLFFGLLVLCVAPSWIWLLLVTPLIAFGVAVSYTMITDILSKLTNGDKQGEILGVNSSVQSLAFALPGAISGLVAAQFSVSAPIVMAAVVVFFGVYIVSTSLTLRRLRS